MTEKVSKTDEQWREELTPEQYYVAREKGTERAFTGEYWDHKGDGTYACAGCGLPLFKSEAKFESGTGWPSFVTAIKGSTGTKRDLVLFIPRTEYHCARCLGHQGHIFDDGPADRGGKRWCNNGVALKFIPA